MSSLVVKAVRIDEIKPHPNADKLELAILGQWQLVVGLGQYKAGDLLVFVPPDAILTPELSDVMNVTQYLHRQRVKAVRLRGEVSHGLPIDQKFVPVPLVEGEDYAEILGITKHTPAVRYLPGDCLAPDPQFPIYTDIENLRHNPGIFQLGEEVVVTEKIHGMNARVGMVNGELMAGSHRTRRKPVEDMAANTFWYPHTIPGIKKLLEADPRNNTVVYGEIYGKGVQVLDYGTPRGFAAFDISVNDRYLNYNEFRTLCWAFEIPTVPVIDQFVWEGPESIRRIREDAEGMTTLSAKHIREGVVVRPVVERWSTAVGRVILKYVSDAYLAKDYSAVEVDE